MQPNVTPGAVLELNAAKAANGTSPGINSPLTTTWTDTSGNGNNGTLTNFTGTTSSGWAGTGTSGDPYRVVFADIGDKVAITSVPNLQLGNGNFTIEVWPIFPFTSDFRGVFIGQGFDGTGPAGSWTLHQSGTTQYTAGCYFSSGLGTTAYYSDFSALSSGVHQLVVTRSNRTYQKYSDGAMNGSSTTSSVDGNLNLTTPIQLGVSGWGLSGAVVIARIYPFALSSVQVQANYNAGPTW